MEWLIQLQGNIKDLTLLKDSVNTPELEIIQEDSLFYLNYKPFGIITDHMKVLSEAKTIVPMLNAISVLVHGSNTPIQVFDRVIRVSDDGIRKEFVVATLTVRYRTLPYRCQKADGTIFKVTPESVVSAYFNLAMQNTDVKRIFERVSSNFEAPWSFFNIYEDIFENMNGEIPWVDDKEIDRLKATVNSRKLLGMDARHGKGYTKQGKPFSDHDNPMTIPEAQSLIWTIIINWLEYKMKNP